MCNMCIITQIQTIFFFSKEEAKTMPTHLVVHLNRTEVNQVSADGPIRQLVAALTLLPSGALFTAGTTPRHFAK